MNMNNIHARELGAKGSQQGKRRRIMPSAVTRKESNFDAVVVNRRIERTVEVGGTSVARLATIGSINRDVVTALCKFSADTQTGFDGTAGRG